MNLKWNGMIVVLGAMALAAAPTPGYANEGCPGQEGRLLDFRETTEMAPVVQVGRVHQTGKSNGNKEWITVMPPPMRKKTTYTVTVAVDGMIYTARSSGDFWGYNPAAMVVNSRIQVCVEPKRLVITRPDGRQYKPTIIRREKEQARANAPAGSAPSGE